MSTSSGPAQGHSLGDPREALDHFTPDRMAQARPRGIELDEHGGRVDQDGAGTTDERADEGRPDGTATDDGCPDEPDLPHDRDGDGAQGRSAGPASGPGA